MPDRAPDRPLAGPRAIPWRRAARALVRTGLLLVAASFLSLVLVDLAPGDVLSDLRLNPRVSVETVERLRMQYGLDRPIAVRYGRWVQSAARGELGFSALYNSTVWPILQPRLLNTLLLTTAAMLVAWLAALPIGVWAAVRRGRTVDRGVGAIVAVLVATPELLIGLAALRLALLTGWFPAGGMTSAGGPDTGWIHVADVLHHATLPLAALTLAQLPALVRHVRAAMIESLEAPSLVMGRGLGLSPRRLIWRHALKMAALPLSALFGLSIASLLSASLAIEVVTGWPGLGPLLVEATLAHDAHLVAGATTAATVVVLAGVGVATMLAWLVDPRTRQEPAA